MGIRTWYLCVLALLCLWTDMRKQRISNGCVLLLFLGGAWFYTMGGNVEKALGGLQMLGISALILFPLYGIGSLGAGDVKLLCGVGFYIGRDRIAFYLLGFLFSGIVYSFGKMIYGGTFQKRWSYFFQYCKQSILTRQLCNYGIPKEKKEIIHMAVPVMIGVVVWCIGGVMT